MRVTASSGGQCATLVGKFEDSRVVRHAACQLQSASDDEVVLGTIQPNSVLSQRLGLDLFPPESINLSGSFVL